MPIRRRETNSYEPTERHPADRRPIDAQAVQDRGNLPCVVVESARRAQVTLGASLAGQREAQHAKPFCQRIDTRTLVLPPSLNPRNEDEWRSGADVDV
jgi:hypothetical protein